MDNIQTLIYNTINDKLPFIISYPIFLILKLIEKIADLIDNSISKNKKIIIISNNTSQEDRFQYLLEKPNNFKFDKEYLNSVTDSSSPLIKCLD